MSGPLTLYSADWVIPVDGAPIRDGGILVTADGWIHAVGALEEMQRTAHGRRVRLGRSAICPGLINVHTHPDLGLFRGALEDLGFPEWIRRLTRIHGSLDPSDLEAGAALSLHEMVRGGTTTFAATEQTGASIGPAGRIGMRGVVYLEVFGPDPAAAGASIEDLQRRVDRCREAAGGTIRVGVSPHAPYTVSDELYRRVGGWAREEELPLAVHIAESREERDLVVRGRGGYADLLRGRGIEPSPRASSPIALLGDLGVLSPASLLIHCVHLDEGDADRIAAAGAAVAHCPTANARLGHGIAPLGALLERGVRIGLGTDSAASNNRLDLLEEARFASLLYRALAGDPTGMSAGEALRIATLGGARCLGMEQEVGSLAPGKRADFCVVSLAAPHLQPVHDPYAALVHAARASDVVMTVVQGEVVWDAERPEIPPELMARIERGAEKIGAAIAAADTRR